MSSARGRTMSDFPVFPAATPTELCTESELKILIEGLELTAVQCTPFPHREVRTGTDSLRAKGGVPG